MKNNIIPHFEVHPSVVYQLGESLISDAVQALIELVKNSYDADASYAKVIIDTHGVVDVENAIYSGSKGRIIVEDDGSGMGLVDVESGWLTISNRKKRKLKEAKSTTPGGRTPLGDKGLGRLGVQRLGENLEIFTKSKQESGYHFGFSWTDFETAPKLEDVDIHLNDINYSQSQGTKVVISELREPDYWRGQAPLKRLEQELSRMISPYKKLRDFSVIVEVDGKRLELLEISDNLRNVAPIRYYINFDGTELVIKGRARLDFFRSSASQKEADQFSLLAESDNGKAFWEFLKNQKIAKSLNLLRSKSNKWFVEFTWHRMLMDLDKIVEAPENNNYIANPGPFFGEVDSFDLGATAFKFQSVFDRMNEYRKHIKSLSGIRVYRDGFAIRVDHDWLKLGAQWTSASSYYGLKPDTTLGYIALSARDNILLEETTDREGFKDSPYYRNFYALLEDFKKCTTVAHEFFGRSWTEFRKVRNESLAQVNSRKTVEEISHSIKNKLSKAPEINKTLNTLHIRLNEGIAISKKVISKLESTNNITNKLRNDLANELNQFKLLISEANNITRNISTYLEEIGALKGMGQVLEDRVEKLRYQMDYMYEAVSLGLTAEALSHEIFNIADSLAKHAKSAQSVIKNKPEKDRRIIAFVEYVHSSVMSLRKQMSYLSPSLRYVREQRHEIYINDFIKGIKEFYSERLLKNKITLEVIANDKNAFYVYINRGKLTQVVDNLILNSEYWLKEDIQKNNIKKGTIYLDISRPFVRVYDDGRGIDKNIELILFEPFVTAKAKGEGRGLGLFIVKQLLDSEGCSIGLLPERNKSDRLFKFQIDLRGALHG